MTSERKREICIYYEHFGRQQQHAKMSCQAMPKVNDNPFREKILVLPDSRACQNRHEFPERSKFHAGDREVGPSNKLSEVTQATKKQRRKKKKPAQTLKTQEPLETLFISKK